jgi:predicted transcriptional regulator
MATKMTLRDYYNELSALVSASAENGSISTAKATELTAFINGRIDILAKKNATTGERKPTKNQIANQKLAQTILDVMEENTAYTISQILKMLDASTLNQSKISAVVRGMLIETKDGTINPNGTIKRTMEKGVAYFQKIEANTDTEEEEEEG